MTKKTTLTLRNIDTDLIDRLKHDTGTKTAAKAILYACRDYPSLLLDVHRYSLALSDARLEIDRLNSIISDLDSACRSLIETSGQQSLLD